MLIAKLEKKPNFRTENVDRIDEKNNFVEWPKFGGKPHGNWKKHTLSCYLLHAAHRTLGVFHFKMNKKIIIRSRRMVRGIAATLCVFASGVLDNAYLCDCRHVLS